MTTKMLSLIQKINSEGTPQVQSHSSSKAEAHHYACQLFERLAKGKDSSVLKEYQDHEAAAEALTYLLWLAIKRGIPND